MVMAEKNLQNSIQSEIIALIPAYNPDKGMIDLIEDLAVHFSHIVIVDDGCDEGYKQIFEKAEVYPQVKILRHEENKGKGRAIKTGFDYIL